MCAKIEVILCVGGETSITKNEGWQGVILSFGTKHPLIGDA